MPHVRIPTLAQFARYVVGTAAAHAISEPVRSLDLLAVGTFRPELTATRTLTICLPSAVYRISGSAPRFPMISMYSMTSTSPRPRGHYSRMTETAENALTSQTVPRVLDRGRGTNR